MFRLLDKVQQLERSGKRILHFEIGEPDFDTPPHITQAAIESLHRNETHYTSSMGTFELREAICQTTKKSRNIDIDISQVLVTPGANSIIYFAIRCLVNPGEEVIIPDPGFPTYLSALNACGAIPVAVPLKEENCFRMQPQDLEKKIGKNTRLIILNSPNNPTGGVNTADEIRSIAEIAKKHDIYLISDEIYARMIFNEDHRFLSPAYLDSCNERTIILNGFSKAFAMTGWRLGAAIGPTEVISKMGLLLQTIVSCVPQFVQRAGIAAINGNQEPVKDMMREYKRRRDILVEGLNSIPNISCLLPEGAIYLFANIKKTGLTSQDFCDTMLEEAGVALLPGSNFGQFGEGYVRMCYVNSVENSLEAIEKMKQVLAK